MASKLRFDVVVPGDCAERLAALENQTSELNRTLESINTMLERKADVSLVATAEQVRALAKLVEVKVDPCAVAVVEERVQALSDIVDKKAESAGVASLADMQKLAEAVETKAARCEIAKVATLAEATREKLLTLESSLHLKADESTLEELRCELQRKAGVEALQAIAVRMDVKADAEALWVLGDKVDTKADSCAVPTNKTMLDMQSSVELLAKELSGGLSKLEHELSMQMVELRQEEKLRAEAAVVQRREDIAALERHLASKADEKLLEPILATLSQKADAGSVPSTSQFKSWQNTMQLKLDLVDRTVSNCAAANEVPSLMQWQVLCGAVEGMQGSMSEGAAVQGELRGEVDGLWEAVLAKADLCDVALGSNLQTVEQAMESKTGTLGAALKDGLAALADAIERKAEAMEYKTGALDVALKDGLAALSETIERKEEHSASKREVQSMLKLLRSDTQSSVAALVRDVDVLREEANERKVDAIVEELRGDLLALSEAVQRKVDADQVGALREEAKKREVDVVVTELRSDLLALSEAVGRKADSDDLLALSEAVGRKVDSDQVCSREELEATMDSLLSDVEGLRGRVEVVSEQVESEAGRRRDELAELRLSTQRQMAACRAESASLVEGLKAQIVERARSTDASQVELSQQLRRDLGCLEQRLGEIRSARPSPPASRTPASSLLPPSLSEPVAAARALAIAPGAQASWSPAPTGTTPIECASASLPASIEVPLSSAKKPAMWQDQCALKRVRRHR